MTPTDRTPKTCRACGQPVVVGFTRRGDWTELNPEPSESGTARLVDQSPWSPVVEFGATGGERYEVHKCPPSPEPCGCLAYDPEHNPHTAEEHSSCGGVYRPGTPCGGCDDCVAAQVWHYRRLEREEV